MRTVVASLAVAALIAWGTSASHAITVAAPSALTVSEAESALVVPVYYYRRYYRPYYRRPYYRPYYHYRLNYNLYFTRPYYYRRYWW